VRKDTALNDAGSHGHSIYYVLRKKRFPRQISNLQMLLQQSESTEQLIGQIGIGAAVGDATGAGVVETTGAGVGAGLAAGAGVVETAGAGVDAPGLGAG
jgi:hypothetical protein